jgi:hypothetical protein
LKLNEVEPRYRCCTRQKSKLKGKRKNETQPRRDPSGQSEVSEVCLVLFHPGPPPFPWSWQ